MSDGFSLFTSLRYDAGLKQVPVKGLEHAAWNLKNESSFYMLDYHRDRMLRAATHWQWKDAIDVLSGDEALVTLANLTEEFIGSDLDKPRRVKIVVDRQGKISFESSVTLPVSLENLFPIRLPPPGSAPAKDEPRVFPRWAVVPDDLNTARSEYTHYKTTQRDMYDSARRRVVIALTDEKEVLLTNKEDGSIMEGSMTTPYFWRDGRWVTPPVSSKFSLEDGSGGQDGTSRRWALERGIVVEQVVKAESLVDGEECWISNGVRGFIAGVIRLK
ncbi:hypothetical protein PT974_11686 [Cladobotryum mycophilum]|uniref:Aminodeoxychorismate lyase n=1 Tax=Cladobotryum mycophilum TaxID=491253 RepID=A0ABR0S5X0_9HYPO